MKIYIEWLTYGASIGKGIYLVDYTLFFYKNKVYKNAEPQVWWNLKNILDAEIDRVFNLFLSWNTEAQIPF